VNDKWTIKEVKFTRLDKFIVDVEKLIFEKSIYFESDHDQFTIEFNWFRFYNSLSVTGKLIVSELKSKNNWRKSFLVFISIQCF
jgi:hypothetical protein